jgi:hypothetical protein
MTEYTKKLCFMRHDVWNGGAVSITFPLGDKVEISRISATGLTGVLWIRLGREYVLGDIMVVRDEHFVPVVPISVRPDYSVAVDYSFSAGNSTARVNEHVTVTYEMVVWTRVEDETKEPVPTTPPSPTREDIENIVEEKIKSMIGDLSDEDVTKIIQEFRGRKC